MLGHNQEYRGARSQTWRDGVSDLCVLWTQALQKRTDHYPITGIPAPLPSSPTVDELWTKDRETIHRGGPVTTCGRRLPSTAGPSYLLASAAIPQGPEPRSTNLASPLVRRLSYLAEAL